MTTSSNLASPKGRYCEVPMGSSTNRVLIHASASDLKPGNVPLSTNSNDSTARCREEYRPDVGASSTTYRASVENENPYTIIGQPLRCDRESVTQTAQAMMGARGGDHSFGNDGRCVEEELADLMSPSAIYENLPLNRRSIYPGAPDRQSTFIVKKPPRTNYPQMGKSPIE